MDARQAEAVGLSEVIGIRPAARQMGVPESTLRHWRDKPEMAQLRAETKDAVAADMWAGFQLGVARIIELLPTEKDLKAVAIATGVIFDKHALLTGGATHRSENRDITGSLSDGELIAAVREAERITGEDGTKTPPEGEAAG
jgi:hypothetical protein